MTIRNSGLGPEQAAYFQQLSKDVQTKPLSADQRTQLEKAVQALGDDEVVSLSTLAKLRLAEDIKPHFLQMTLAHRFGSETAKTLTDGQGLAAGIKSLADASGAPVAEIEGRLAAFHGELQGPGLELKMESGLRLREANIEFTDENTARVTSGSPPDTPAGKFNHFAATLRRSDGQWHMQIEYAHPENYDGPKTLPMSDLPRDTLLTLQRSSAFEANKEYSGDPRAAVLADYLGDVVTEKNGELGFFPPANPRFSIDGRPKKLSDVTKIEMRPTGGHGFSDKMNTGDFIKGDDGQWTLHLHAPQQTPDGPRSTVEFSEIPTHTLLEMEHAVQYATESAGYESSTTEAGLKVLLPPIQQELARRRAGVEDKLRDLFGGQLVQRTTLSSLGALAEKLLAATGLDAASKLQRAGETTAAACDSLAMAITATGVPQKTKTKQLATAGKAIRELGTLDSHKMRPVLAGVVDRKLRLALGTLDNLRTPIRGSAKDLENLESFRNQAVAYLEKTGSTDTKLLEGVKTPGWAEARINSRSVDTKTGKRLAEAKEMLDDAAALLRTLQRTARLEGSSAARATSALWMEAMDSVQAAADAMRAAEASTRSDRELDPDVTGELMASLRGFKQTWSALLKTGATTTERYRDAIVDAQYLTKVSPLGWRRA